MSEKLPAVKPKDLIRVLQKKGWQLGPHPWQPLRPRPPGSAAGDPGASAQPRLKTGTLAAILRNANISREELRELL